MKIMENKNTYSELLYKSNPFNYTIPSLLEAHGKLYGLNPKDSRKARVLELGSSFGGNIITQALYNPEAECIGIEMKLLKKSDYKILNLLKKIFWI